MTTFHLKLLAILTMIIDHVGLFFFPDQLWMRMVGRLSFPLFAWLIANGAIHTGNSYHYLGRLVIFAVISQIPYDLAHRAVIPDFSGFNIFFTLSLGLAAIILSQQFKHTLFIILAASLFGLVAEVIDSDYGIYGVFSIVFFYHYFKNIPRTILSQSMLVVLFNTVPFFLADRIMLRMSINSISFIQPLALFSLFFIARYNGQKGPGIKYLFYLFYPLHFLLIYFLLIEN